MLRHSEVPLKLKTLGEMQGKRSKNEKEEQKGLDLELNK